MTEFNVSKYVFPKHSDANHGLEDICLWLDEHVGEWDTSVKSMTSDICRQGKGWQIRSEKSKNTGGFKVISWYAVIDDEQLATLFALTWTK